VQNAGLLYDTFKQTPLGKVDGQTYLPIAMIALFSVNASDVMAFPLTGFTTRWFAEIFGDGRLGGGFLTTLSVAFPVALLTAGFGAAAALALTFYATRFRTVFVVLLLMPFLVPRLILNALAVLIVLGNIALVVIAEAIRHRTGRLT